MIRIAAALVLVACVGASPALASFPGDNGRIVFSSNRAVPSEIYSMNADGTDIRRLTWNATQDQFPRVSRDGTRIVFARTVAGNDLDIWIMNADGSGERQLTSGPARDDQPAFTPDGERVVFQRVPGAQGVCPCEVRIVSVDGTDERRVDTGPGNAANPDLSKNGKLAFVGDRDGTRSIYVTNLRGGPVKRVTVGPALAFGDYRPRWSPRGNDLVFMRNELGPLSSIDVWTVHHDGSDLRRLTTTERIEDFPQWSPDGTRIVFAVLQATAPFAARLYTMDADGSGERLLPQLVEISDSFDGPALDASTWWTAINGTGSGVAAAGGRLETSLAADATNGPSGFMGPGVGSQCRVVGDYDARVRYELLDWPFSNGVHVLLGDAGTTGSIGRRSESGFEDYLAFFNPVPASQLTTHAAGELRLARTGAVLTAYYREGATWVPLLSGPTTTAPTFVNVHLFSDDAIFGDRFVRVAYDDFRVSADSFACPTFWRDTTPDWAVG